MFVFLGSGVKMCLMIFFSSQVLTFRSVRTITSVKEKGRNKV
jgi:hypothetical protein